MPQLVDSQVRDSRQVNLVIGAEKFLPDSPSVFQAVCLERAEIVAGSVRLILADRNGLTQSVDLQPHAEAQISTALLTGYTTTTGKFHERGPVMADDISITTFKQPDCDATAMIEIQLTDKAALNVALPLRLERKLLACLLRRRETNEDPAI